MHVHSFVRSLTRSLTHIGYSNSNRVRTAPLMAVFLADKVPSELIKKVMKLELENGNDPTYVSSLPSKVPADLFFHYYSFNQSSTHSLTHSLTYSLTHLLTYSLTHLLTYSLTHSLTHSFNQALTHLLTYSLIPPHSFYHLRHRF